MSKIIELREKRATLWDSAKAFLDSKRDEKGLISAEDTAAYEKMEQEVVDLGREIDRLERQQTLDMEFSKATSTPLRNAPGADQPEEKTGRATNEYRNAFWKSMRNKFNHDVYNALQIGTDSEGGYLVPDEFERTLVEKLEEENVMRQLCDVIKTSNGERKIPVVASKGTASWIDEGEDIDESDDTFSQVTIRAYKLGTMLKVSDELLNDSVFNLEQYIAKEFARRMGRAEENAFIVGDGDGKPTGILDDDDGAEVGVTTLSATTINLDNILDLFYSLREPYRKKATFVMNDVTIKAIRKLKDSTGQYLWQPSIQVGQPDTLLNRPIKTSNDMPVIAAGAKAVAFGDFKYYWIADRQGRSFQRLNELYATKGQVGFKATQRVDGKLILPEAIKVLQMTLA